MSNGDVEREEDLTPVCFEDVYFPLSHDNWLDYLSMSVPGLYDRTCLNEVVRSQAHVVTVEDAKAYIEKMDGIEYCLDEELSKRDPDLFIITKRRRTGGTVTPLAKLYIDGRKLLQAPTVHKVLSTRITAASYYLAEALKEVSALSTFSPHEWYTWKNVGRKREEPETTRSTKRKRPDLAKMYEGKK